MIPFALIAEGEAKISYQFARLDLLDQWWHWLMLIAVCGLIASYVVFWYRRDWGEIPRPLGVALLVLRLTALLGIFLFFLDLQKRTEQKITRPSRVAVAIDTSLSMTLPLDPSPNGDPRSRMAAVVETLLSEPLLDQLRRDHDTTVYRFDQSNRPQAIASFSKMQTSENGSADKFASETDPWLLAARVTWFGSLLGMLGIVCLLSGMLGRYYFPRAYASPYIVLGGTVLSLMSVVVIGTAAMRASDYPFLSLWQQDRPSRVMVTMTKKEEAKPLSKQNPAEVKWSEMLVASGSETRLGDTLKSLLEVERGSPLAGIVVITDGQNTTGLDPLATIPDAIAARVPVVAIGLGSEKNPTNVRLVELEAPKRVFPGDRFRLTGLLQSTGLAGKRVTVQLRCSSFGAKADKTFKIEDEQSIELSSDETIVPVNFDVVPKEIGEWSYELKLTAPQEDSTLSDNALDTLVRVIQPKFKVLTIAGGPSREYQFVRNLLFRESTVQSHVFLQTGGPGISQEAHLLLDDFPNTIKEMAEYDCVIAFDADWMKLKTSQLEVLDEWVSRLAGGLVLIAGPVATPRWTGSEGNGDRRAELLRGLAPVELNPRGTRLISVGRFEGTTAWPLRFSEDGRRMDFLSIGTSMLDTKDTWERFSGIYSYYATFNSKQGAMTLAEFSDPTTANDGKLPIYLASHFFGSGRVVFQGSGEIWRMRELGVNYFDTYYTKLIRWVGQSRLLRDSNRGMLLVESEEAIVGEQISLRAVLKDSQFQPLLLPQVEARLTDPQQRSTPLVLSPLQDPSQPGVYLGQFLAGMAGTYQVQLTVGGLADQEILTQQMVVRVPTREIQRTQRNDAVLSELSSKTGGEYFVSLKQAMETVAVKGGSTSSRVAAKILPQDQINYLAGAPDREFQQRLMTSLMALIGGALSLEWLLRRLSKLA